MEGLRKLWAKYRAIVDWFKANVVYLIIIPRLLLSRPVLNVILALMVAFGVCGPETADRFKEAVLGSDLANAIEVIDNAQ